MLKKIKSWTLKLGSRAIPIVAKVVETQFRFEWKGRNGKCKFVLFFSYLSRTCIRFKHHVSHIFQLIPWHLNFNNISWAPFILKCFEAFYIMLHFVQMCLSIVTDAIVKWQVYSFSSLFISDVATLSQKDHKLFSATNILSNKNYAIER